MIQFLALKKPDFKGIKYIWHTFEPSNLKKKKLPVDTVFSLLLFYKGGNKWLKHQGNSKKKHKPFWGSSLQQHPSDWKTMQPYSVMTECVCWNIVRHEGEGLGGLLMLSLSALSSSGHK